MSKTATATHTCIAPVKKPDDRALLLAGKDIAAERNEHICVPPSFIASYFRRNIDDERDLPLVYLFFNIACLLIPSISLVYYTQSHLVGAVYIAGTTFFLQERFLLALHVAAHRKLSKNPFIANFALYALCPFFGIPSGMYRSHHVIMHHVENNVFPWDVSSTEPYQRDNVLHFIFYWLRFIIAIWVELPYYAFKRNRIWLAWQTVGECTCFIAAVYFLYQWYPTATLWVFIIKTIVNSFVLMFGNWSQHIFVDPAKPRDNYHLTYNIIDAKFNQRTFNDGYHVEHHVNARRHWTDLPVNFGKQLDKYREEDALVFHGAYVDWFVIGFEVMTGDYKSLVKQYVNLQSPPLSDAQIEAKLRSRLAPIKVN